MNRKTAARIGQRSVSPIANSDRRLSDDQLLSFFWDKWKIGNELAYKQWSSFWATTGVAIGGAVALLSGDLNFRTLALCSGLLVSGGVLGLYWRRVVDIHVRVRNTHNPEIVDLLHRSKLLEHIDISQPHDPDDHRQAVNQWHARPRDFIPGGPLDFRGTGILAGMMRTLAILQIVIGLAVFVAGIWILK